MDGHKFKGSLNQPQASLGYSGRLSRRIKLKTNLNDRNKREREKKKEQNFPNTSLNLVSHPPTKRGTKKPPQAVRLVFDVFSS